MSVLWKTKPEVTLNPSDPNELPQHAGQVLLRYTAEGSPLENDMIVYFSGRAGRKRGGGRQIGDPIGIGAGLGLNLALSKGQIKLNSNNYQDRPYLDYNLLDDPEDLRRYRDGIRMLVSLENDPALSELIENRVHPTDTDLESDASLDAWIKKNVGTGHHVSCTAKMGPESDPMAVVDQYGKLYGIDGLRVAEASIMPECVRANINVTVMVIGEMVADFIKQGK